MASSDLKIYEPSEVIDYWFGTPGSPERGQRRDIWFKDGRSIDDEIRDQFLPLHEEAASGGRNLWREDPRSCLALIIVLDQFPRHMFRDGPLAYATDPQALETAKHALNAQFDCDRPLLELNFFYLPFSHAEDLSAQHRGVELRRAIPEHEEKAKSVERAIEHMEIVARFGRFPHRNEILGRESTPEEISFLGENPDAWFVKYLKRAETGS